MPNQALRDNITHAQAATGASAWRYAALGLSALILSLTLTYPFNNDNALYAYMADLLLHGKLPYLGSWDQNFPGIVVIQVVPLLLGLRSQFAFHLYDVVIQLAGCWILFRIVLTVANARAAFLAAVLAALYYVQQGLWMAGERDTYATVLLLAAILLAIKPAKTYRTLFAIGLLSGSIVLLRPTYGLYAVCFAILEYFRDGGSAISLRLRRAFAIVVGSVVPIAIALLIYTAAGGLGELWLSTIVYNFSVYGGKGEQFAFWEPVRFYAISIPAVVAGVAILWKQGSKQFLVLWVLTFLSSTLSLVLLYRHSVYHYHPAMVLFILMSAIGWERLTGLFANLVNRGGEAREGLRLTGIVLIALFFTFQMLRGNTVHGVIRALIHGEIHSMQQMYAMYEGSPSFGEPVQREVGEYLKEHTRPGDNVQMFGPYSYPQYAARLGTASRFQTLHAIAMRGSGDSLQPFQREWRVEYLRDMVRMRPLYFIVCDAPEAFRQYYGGMLGHEILKRDFVGLRDWLEAQYHEEKRIGAFTLYRAN